MNYKNDLDECLTFYIIVRIYLVLEYLLLGRLTYFQTLINYQA
jgi:hypothetical protein